MKSAEGTLTDHPTPRPANEAINLRISGEKSLQAITGMFEWHMKEFKEVPELHLSEEGTARLRKYTQRKIREMPNDLMDTILVTLGIEDDEDNEEYNEEDMGE